MEESIHAMLGEVKQIFQFEQYVMEELRGQKFYTSSVSLPAVVVSSSHIGGNEEMPV